MRVANASDTTPATADVAGVIAPPPLLYGAGLGAGLLAERVVPAPPVPAPVRRVLGPVLLAGGAALIAWAVYAMERGGTPMPVNRPSRALITTGPFRFSRNPGYVGVTILYAGISLLLNRTWPLILLPAILAVLQRGVVEREERYLERKFGDAYRRYRQSVRRWL